MGTSRRFPLDEPAAGPLRAQRGGDPVSVAAASAGARWPVLARIEELNRASDAHGAESDAASRASYRVDAPHASTPSPVQQSAAQHSPMSLTPPQPAAVPSAPSRPAVAAATLQRNPATKPAATSAAGENSVRTERMLRAAPMPIRVALKAWQWVEPHQKLIRLAAMVTLMSAGGMALFTVMNKHETTIQISSQPAAVPVESVAAPKLEIQHAEHNPEIIPTTGPAAEVDTLEPTATGPLPAPSKPLIAAETEEPRTTLPYPTTVRPEPLDSIIAAGQLPQAQFEEEPAVARLKGTVEESQIR